MTIKEGFQWYSNAGAKLGTTTDQDYTMYYDQANNQMVRQLKTDENGEIAADAITMTKGPDKTLYFKGDTFDKTGLSFTVKYADKDASGKNRTETIPADKVIVGDCDFNGDEAGKVKVPVYVNGAEYEVEVDYQSQAGRYLRDGARRDYDRRTEGNICNGDRSQGERLNA